MVGISKTFKKELNETERSSIWGMHVAGWSGRRIARHKNLPNSTVADTIRRIEQNIHNGLENVFQSQPRSGRPKKLCSRDVRHLIRCAIQDRKATLQTLSTPSKSGHAISRFQVRAVLKAHGKARRRARKKPYLRKQHRQRRLAFARRNKYTHWTVVCWSDEAYFWVGEDTRDVYVTRGSDEAFLPECLRPTHKGQRIKVGVWGCFCGPFRGPLVVLPQGTIMNRDTYTDKVFIPHFLPFYLKMKSIFGSGTYLQEDGATYHHNGFLGKLKAAWDCRILEWPANSPDLSPIENLWKWMKNRISERIHRIRNAAQMELALVEVWGLITADVLMNLVASMPRRLAECIKNKGGATKY